MLSFIKTLLLISTLCFADGRVLAGHRKQVYSSLRGEVQARRLGANSVQMEQKERQAQSREAQQRQSQERQSQERQSNERQSQERKSNERQSQEPQSQEREPEFRKSHIDGKVRRVVYVDEYIRNYEANPWKDHAVEWSPRKSEVGNERYLKLALQKDFDHVDRMDPKSAKHIEVFHGNVGEFPTGEELRLERLSRVRDWRMGKNPKLKDIPHRQYYGSDEDRLLEEQWMEDIMTDNIWREFDFETPGSTRGDEYRYAMEFYWDERIFRERPSFFTRKEQDAAIKRVQEKVHQKYKTNWSPKTYDRTIFEERERKRLKLLSWKETLLEHTRSEVRAVTTYGLTDDAGIRMEAVLWRANNVAERLGIPETKRAKLAQDATNKAMDEILIEEQAVREKREAEEAAVRARKEHKKRREEREIAAYKAIEDSKARTAREKKFWHKIKPKK
eukprot:GHVH01009973.1.p1 GENE.GHVH01009973.1~~GHVH01009973.1.p1  ORF type:complete len:446 (+),score=63.03 GHVH01009973.1:158-1495(+)